MLLTQESIDCPFSGWYHCLHLPDTVLLTWHCVINPCLCVLIPSLLSWEIKSKDLLPILDSLGTHGAYNIVGDHFINESSGTKMLNNLRDDLRPMSHNKKNLELEETLKVMFIKWIKLWGPRTLCQLSCTTKQNKSLHQIWPSLHVIQEHLFAASSLCFFSRTKIMQKFYLCITNTWAQRKCWSLWLNV